ncbi:MAG: hypothetical protein ACYSWP_03115 [Planctomycetota bacterium]|jgi:hypothetical protein
MSNKISFAILFAGSLLMIALSSGCAPKTFVRGDPEWKTIEFNVYIAGDFVKAWQKCVDTISKDYLFEMLDRDSGYLCTSWKYGICGEDRNRYRGRIIVKFPELTAPTKVRIKAEAQWLSDKGNATWDRGMDAVFQRDVITELSGRLGTTVTN